MLTCLPAAASGFCVRPTLPLPGPRRRHGLDLLRKSTCSPCFACAQGHTMLQNDHLGKPMFVHANLLKQIPSGVGPGASLPFTSTTPCNIA